jgi:hypothetical protein
MAFKNLKNQCTAMSKTTGERCGSPAVSGYNVCYHHGANPNNRGGRGKGCTKPEGSGAPSWGKQNALKHGAYTPKLQPEEQPMYEALLAEYMEDVPNPTVTDRHAISRLAVLETKWHTAVTQGAPADALDVLHRLLHRELKALQVTRESKDSSANQGTSPAEVVATLLMKVREHALATRQAPALPQGASDDVVIEVDAGDDGDGTDA